MEVFNIANFVGIVLIDIEVTVDPVVGRFEEIRSGLAWSDVLSEDVFPLSVGPSSLNQILKFLLLLFGNIFHEEFLGRWLRFLGMRNFVVLAVRDCDLHLEHMVVAVAHFFDVFPPHRHVREDSVELIVGSFERFSSSKPQSNHGPTFLS